MNRLPMETLKNAIGVYKNTLAVCKELADEDYSPALDKATLSFLEELKEYRGYGTVEEFKELKEKEQKKITTWLNDARIEIIDEFVKYLKKDLEKMSDIDYEKGIRGDNEAYGRSQAYGESMDLVDKIAEQLKG